MIPCVEAQLLKDCVVESISLDTGDCATVDKKVLYKRYPLEYAGTRMSWGKAVAAKGTFAFLSGSEGINAETNQVVKGMKAQTELALKKLKIWLQEVGTSLESIVKLVIYVTDMDTYWDEAQPTLNSFFKEDCPSFLENPPPIDLLQVAGLARKDMLIEISAIVLVPEK